MLKLGIVGYGFVGKATEITLRKFYTPKFEVAIYDKKIIDSSIHSMKDCDYIFIALPTPPTLDGRCDTSIIESALVNLDVLQVKVPIIIRSTVVPRSTDLFRKQFPSLKINFMPEFLTEAQFWYDAENPYFIVIGGEEAEQIKQDLFQEVTSIPVYCLTAVSAELLKYFLNTFFATKVIFSNQMFDIATGINADYDEIWKIATKHPFVGQNHFDVNFGGYRGYGGKCLPKDTKAIAYGFDNEFFQTIDRLNEELVSKK